MDSLSAIEQQREYGVKGMKAKGRSARQADGSAGNTNTLFSSMLATAAAASVGEEEQEEAQPAKGAVCTQRFEVCRTFLATLQLANNGNVLLEHHLSAADESTPFRLSLLTTERAYDFESYRAPEAGSPVGLDAGTSIAAPAVLAS